VRRQAAYIFILAAAPGDNAVFCLRLAPQHSGKTLWRSKLAHQRKQRQLGYALIIMKSIGGGVATRLFDICCRWKAAH